MEKTKFIDKFYGGIVRDDKSGVTGGAFNIEEFDIFRNQDYIIPEQVMSADSMPASTEIYAYTADNSDNVWGYGKETSGNKIRLVKVTTGGADNPGAFSTVFTSGDSSDLAYAVSPVQYFRRDDGNQDFLYYVSNNSGTIKLRAYDITADSETETDTGAQNMTLSQLTGSYDRITLKVIYGELYITNGQYISKVDKDGVFTEDAFTLPNGWEAVDITEVSDVAVILARSINRNLNESRAFWWDLTSTLQVDDSFDIPMGGPQWITKFKEKVILLCAQNGIAKLFTLSGAFPGAVPLNFPGNRLENVQTDGATQPVSSSKMLDTKDDVLYFGLYKTDKTGIYGIGQLDSNKPLATILSKRFIPSGTSDYVNHKPTALRIQGPNFFAAYYNSSTASNSRCESKNSPDRSSDAVYESVIIDDNDPTTNKTLTRAYLTSYPLPASCSLDMYVDPDYSESYTQITRPDDTVFNTANGLLGFFKPKSFVKKKVYRVKVEATSNGTDAPKLTGVGLKMNIDETEAHG